MNHIYNNRGTIYRYVKKICNLLFSQVDDKKDQVKINARNALQNKAKIEHLEKKYFLSQKLNSVCESLGI